MGVHMSAAGGGATSTPFGSLLRCPQCHATGLLAGANTQTCADCGSAFPFDRRRGVLAMTRSVDPNKEKVRAFWGDLALQWYSENDKTLTRETLTEQLDAVEAFFRHRGQMAVVEMPIDELADKTVLEIGSGGGAHSALFKRMGARMVSLDITPERVLSTALKLQLVDGAPSLAIEGDAENLPFTDEAFEIVYSNGVLHHSPNTDETIREIYRVLKPGGLAVIMLYARHSTQYWLNTLPKTLLNGTFFSLPEAEAIGRITEGKPKFNTQPNPYTRVYSKRQARTLFSAFEVESVRKSSFRLDYFAIPKATHLRRVILSLFGVPRTAAGPILYGGPLVQDARIELALSPLLGWCLNIKARKPSRLGANPAKSD
jgi:ubiquinone/menaquinone biosynthesis C-methylase UbiE